MPIAFVLVDAAGKAVRIADPSGGTTDAAGDFDRFVGGFDAELPVLGRLDVYDDTALPRGQLDALLREVDHLNQLDLKDVERRGLERLVALIEQCRKDPTTTLWCFGD